MVDPAVVFDDITQKALENEHFRGAVVRVEHFGSLVFEKAWGNALMHENQRIPMSTKHLFDLASLSKLFTSTAILRLVSIGAIELQTSILELTAFTDPLLTTSLAQVDIASLLNHSTGIHYWFPCYTRSDEPFEAILASVIAEHPRKNKVIYSDLNYILLGLAVERILGKPLPQAIRELVFTPLNMHSATYNPDKNNLTNIAASEYGNQIEKRMVSELGFEFTGWRDDTVPIQGTCNDGNCFYYFNGAAGHAGIFADAADAARLGNLYLNGIYSLNQAASRAAAAGNWVSGTDGYLDPAIIKAAVSRQRAASTLDSRASPSESDRGYGFQFGPNYPGGGFGHTGFTGTYLHINPAAGLTVSILTNRLHVHCPKDINPYRQAISKAAIEQLI